MSVRVRDVMSPGPIVVIGPDDDLERAGNVMLWTRVRHLPVVEGPALVGLVSERDLIRARGHGARLVRAAMRSPVSWIGPDDPIESALAMMVSHNFGCLPVVAAEGLVGILTTTDLLRRELYAAFERGPGRQPAGRPVRSDVPTMRGGDGTAVRTLLEHSEGGRAMDADWGHCMHCKHFGSLAEVPLATEEAYCQHAELARLKLTVFGTNGCTGFALREGLSPDVEHPGHIAVPA